MANDENYTPAWLIQRVRVFFGGQIDLDPYSCDEAQATVQAVRYGTKERPIPWQEWHGKIWVNPPYSRKLILEAAENVVRAAERFCASGLSEIILLTNIECSTQWSRTVLQNADALLLPHHRIQFRLPGGRARPARNERSQMLTYFGHRPSSFCRSFNQYGVAWAQEDAW